MRKLLQDFRIMVDNYYHDSNMGANIYTDITNFIDAINESVEGKKPVTQGERFVQLIDVDCNRNLIKVSAIVNITHRGENTIIDIEGRCYAFCCNTTENQEVLENLIADLKSQ
jgi:hypothetical protein